MENRDDTNLPNHIAIIMDGNGRWAQTRGQERREGHRAGVEALRRIVKDSGDLGVHHLTVFSFSTENWGRPRNEVNFLMSLLERYIESDLADLHAEGVRVRVIGRRDGLSDKICRLIDRAERLTAENNRLYLQIAFNYGGREELADAASRLARRAANGTLDAESINSDVLAAELLTAGMPNPDLVIRTSGESRLSNFMLWQSAYAELYFTDVLWPDFTRDDLVAAIDHYTSRERRFGLVSATGQTD
ncbi:MAG: isoprenyl transferase [Parvibaculales bacterium]